MQCSVTIALVVIGVQELLPAPPESDDEEGAANTTDELPLLEAEALLMSMHFLGKTAADAASVFSEANLAEFNKRYTQATS